MRGGFFIWGGWDLEEKWYRFKGINFFFRGKVYFYEELRRVVVTWGRVVRSRDYFVAFWRNIVFFCY